MTDQAPNENEGQSGERQSFRERVWRIIFLSDTRAGQVFDVILLILIGLSVGVVMLESVERLRLDYGVQFLLLEWIFTLIFTIEYVVRLSVVRRKRNTR